MKREVTLTERNGHVTATVVLRAPNGNVGRGSYRIPASFGSERAIRRAEALAKKALGDQGQEATA